VLFVCLSVCLCVLGTLFRWSCTAVTQWCLSVCLSVCWVHHLGGGLVEHSDKLTMFLCLSVYVCLIRYLGGGPVERSDSGVCLSVSLSVCVITLYRW